MPAITLPVSNAGRQIRLFVQLWRAPQQMTDTLPLRASCRTWAIGLAGWQRDLRLGPNVSIVGEQQMRNFLDQQR